MITPEVKEKAQRHLQYIAEREPFYKIYKGQHEPTYYTKQFYNTFGKVVQEMRDNLARLVVLASAERLIVQDFSLDFGKEDVSGTESEDFSTKAWEIWRDSLMPFYELDLYCNALSTGCASVIVWLTDNGLPKIYVQDPLAVYVEKDDETGETLWASKFKTDKNNKRWFIVYTPTEIQRYSIAESASVTNMQLVETINNPYAEVPVFDFQATNVIADIIPLQNALNKALADKLVAMEFAAYPQRYAVGLQYLDDLVGTGGVGDYTRFVAGAHHLWATDDKEVRFGEFSTANLLQFLEVADSYRMEIARISGTPFHLLGIKQSDAISGMALRTLESRFIKRVMRLQVTFGDSWARAMKFALRLTGQTTDKHLTVKWESPQTFDEIEKLDILARKAAILGVPLEVLREEYGYSEGDIERFNKLNADALAFEAENSPNDQQKVANA